MKKYDIENVINLRDNQNLTWKQIGNLLKISPETLRKAYKRIKERKTSHQINPNSYILQKKRGLERKKQFIENLGGKCQICGYNKNIAALEFHHIEPSTKKFQLDVRHLSNTNMQTLQEEIKKCILVCANCHREIHYAA